MNDLPTLTIWSIVGGAFILLLAFAILAISEKRRRRTYEITDKLEAMEAAMKRAG